MSEWREATDRAVDRRDRDSGDKGEKTESASGGVRPPSPRGPRILAIAPVRLLVYYAVLFTVAGLVIDTFPGLEDALDAERDRHILADDNRPTAPDVRLTTADLWAGTLAGVAAFSSLFALCLSIPVAWVYGWVSTRKSYSKSFAQSLLIFPVAVATVVFLVKGSIALAFSLAGIVATVRFRSRLMQARDAIFLFVTIGIGLAAGVQMVLVAFSTSLIFNFVMIAMANRDFGGKPLRLRGWRLEAQVSQPETKKAPKSRTRTSKASKSAAETEPMDAPEAES